MPQFTHAYAVLLGEHRPGTGWEGETAQVGFRLAVWPGATEPDVDAALPVRDYTSGFEAYSDDNFQGSIGWHGEGEYWSTPDQIAVATAARAWADALKGKMFNGFQWTALKLSPISPGGKVSGNPTHLAFKTRVTGIGTTALPPQMSVACSFRAIVPGRRGRGRVFFPMPEAPVLTADGKLAPDAITAFGTKTVDLVEAFNAIGSPGVTTRLVVTSADATTYVLPSHVRIGNHLDTQRRRRAQVRETYSQFDL